ncbi:MAG: hypothetical protein O7D86_05130 [Proteobacteria bacterium]|nr:hypothetical protein [Pseudomonadota bacterium]
MSKPPARDTIYSCQFSSLGGSLDRPWVDKEGTIYFLKKPFVKGSKKWNSSIKFSDGNPDIAVTGNGLPDHKTGDFPIQSGSTAYQDECHGHTGSATDRLGKQINEYHYHINNEFPYTLGCFKGEVDQSMLERHPTPQGDMRGGPDGGRSEGGRDNRRGGPPDLSGVAKKLGVSDRELQRALGPPPPNFKSAAKKLGISERKLKEAMRAAGAP